MNVLEERSRGRVDPLLTVTNFLHEKYSPGYQDSYLSGNGVSRETFESLKQIQLVPGSESDRPQIGYAGMVSERLDWSMIKTLAHEKPEWDFVFHGFIADQRIPGRFEGYDNVRFRGSYSQSELASILSGFSIGILPYLSNEFLDNLLPLRFFEYAAAGLPIVSTRSHELQAFPDNLIQMPEHNCGQWIEALENGLSSDMKELKHTGLQIAEQYVWDNLCDKLIEEIQKRYD